MNFTIVQPYYPCMKSSLKQLHERAAMHAEWTCLILTGAVVWGSVQSVLARLLDPPLCQWLVHSI